MYYIYRSILYNTITSIMLLYNEKFKGIDYFIIFLSKYTVSHREHRYKSAYIQIEWISVDIIHNPSKEETHDFKVGQSISIYVIIFFSILRVVERGVI
jgi:hypothetical protein